MKCRWGCNVDPYLVEDHTTHASVCEAFPCLCPQGCTQKIPRKDLAQHQKQKCPQRMIVCECKATFLATEAEQHRCTLQVKCEYCNAVFQKLQQQEHDDNCTTRKVKLLHFVCPSIEEAAFADMLAQLSGDFDKTMEQVLSMFQPLNNMIEFFHMTKAIRDYHLIQLISVILKFVLSMGLGNLGRMWISSIKEYVSVG